MTFVLCLLFFFLCFCFFFFFFFFFPTKYGPAHFSPRTPKEVFDITVRASRVAAVPSTKVLANVDGQLVNDPPSTRTRSNKKIKKTKLYGEPDSFQMKEFLTTRAERG